MILTRVLLPAPFGPEQTEDFTSVHAQVHPAQCMNALAVNLDNVPKVDGGIGMSGCHW